MNSSIQGLFMPSRLIGLSTLLLTLFLTGCTGGSPEKLTTHRSPEVPQGVPHKIERLQESSDGEDSIDVIEGEVGLGKCIEMALRRNPGLVAARWDADAAGHSVDMAQSARLPELRATADYTDYINDQPLIAIGGDPRASRFTDDIASASLVVDVPIYTGGRITNRIEAAKLLRMASTHTLARTRKELVFNVTSMFYSILAQRHVIESVRFSRKALKEHLEQVKNLITNQKATKSDRLRTEVRLADVKEELARQRNALQVKLHTLRKLLGLSDLSTELDPAGQLKFDAETSPDSNTALSAAYDARSDLAATRKKVKAQSRKLDVARAEYWPNITFQAAYGPRWDVSHMSKAEDAGRFGVGLSLPLFEGGRIRANVLKQKSELEAARQRLRQLKDQVQLEVRTAMENVSSAKERVQASQKAIEQGKESLRIERVKYRNGRASVTEVLDAQDDLLRSQRNYYRALADYHTALAQLRLATGKDDLK